MPNMLSRLALLAVVVGKAASSGICYGQEGSADFCQVVAAQGNCNQKFVEPPLSSAALNTYCADKGFCCVDNNGKRFRPARGQTCADIGKTDAPCTAPVNWCSAVKSASPAQEISSEIQGSEADCRAACIANSECEGFDYAQNPSRCVLLKHLVPYLSSGSTTLSLNPVDDVWTTFVSSFHPSCPGNQLWFNLGESLSSFSLNSGLTGFSASLGTTSTLAQRTGSTPDSQLTSIAGSIIDNFFYVDAVTKTLTKLTGTSTQIAQYKASLATLLHNRLKTSPGQLTTVTWSTPNGPKTTFAVVIGSDAFETLSGTFLPSSLSPSSSKFSTQSTPALPPLLVIGGQTQNQVSKIFKNGDDLTVASFIASITCTEDNECLGGSVARLRMPLCQARSAYIIECNMEDPQIRGCQMYVAFLAACGRPTISYDDSTLTYTVTGTGFTAWQESYKLGKRCDCGITPK